MEEYTVSRLSALIKRSMEQNFSKIQLKAEVSALKVHSSGHLYFALKDAEAVIDAVCWKYVAQKQNIKLQDGMEIKCVGQVTTYPMRSKYQFVVEQFELSGTGELLKILEERKNKLSAEGLFDPSRKKPIPFLPHTIGIITSPTGAVIRDMLQRIGQRFPRHILLWPVLVQGLDACRQIVAAVDGMNALPPDKKPDLLIIARGGGSFEDLMPFNEEDIVRAVARSAIPIISAVGHETDTTLIDYAADLRAPTPTAAAEFAVPEKIKLHADIHRIFSKLHLIMSSNMEKKRLFLKSNKILNIRGIITEKIQRVDYTFDRAMASINKFIAAKKLALAKIILPKPLVKANVNDVFQKLKFLFFTKFETAKNNFAILANGMESNSHVNILRKGFAFVESSTMIPITSVAEAEKYHFFSLTFSDGKIKVRKEATQVDLFDMDVK
ncbi:MAG: exodeoxyribonuclease VII large subunit [Holosporaceae bacterium]|jgi:exodeoxyribonuclease VII large subunit|nr:exodeoxyribonuclease VII large subunit [Holosporaceae bacterium]